MLIVLFNQTSVWDGCHTVLIAVVSYLEHLPIKEGINVSFVNEKLFGAFWKKLP